MTQEPIITIDKFSGTGDGNLIYNEGFLPEIINGKSIMTSGLISETKLGSSSLYQSLTLGNIVSNVNLQTLDNNKIKFCLFLNTNGKIFTDTTSVDESRIKPAKIHDYDATSYPDIFELENNNLIYTGSQYLGKGIRGQATGGSATTIVDSSKDFTALGIVVGDKVTNLKTGWEYTIKTISGTGNNTLEFDSAGSLINASGDEYIVWNDNAFDLLNTISVENWQVREWRRQIKQYGDEYFILNGNYLAKLSADGTTIDNKYKQLPARNQALAFDINNDKILVSSEYKNSSQLLLWDGTTEGWQNIINFDFTIRALVSYKSGWLFMSQGTLYYTDGYNIEELTTIDSKVDIDTFQIGYLEPTYFNGIYYYNKKLYFANSYNDSNLVHYGVYVYDFKNGWSVISQNKGLNAITLGGVPYSIFYLNYENNIGVGGSGFVNEIKSHNVYSSGKANYSFIYYIDLPRPIKITSIGLNIIRPIKKFLNDNSIKQTTIAVNIGDGNRGLIDNVYNTIDSSASNKIRINGTSFYNNEVGDECYVIEATSNTTDYGKRFYITAIANKGEATEEWTLDGNKEQGKIETNFRGNLKMIRVKKMDKRVIYSNELNKEFLFTNQNTGFLSNKLFIEVVVWDSYYYKPMPISISDIKIYGS